MERNNGLFCNSVQSKHNAHKEPTTKCVLHAKVIWHRCEHWAHGWFNHTQLYTKRMKSVLLLNRCIRGIFFRFSFYPFLVRRKCEIQNIRGIPPNSLFIYTAEMIQVLRFIINPTFIWIAYFINFISLCKLVYVCTIVLNAQPLCSSRSFSIDRFDRLFIPSYRIVCC